MDSLSHYLQVSKACAELFSRKNEEYGDTIHRTGVLGATVELIGVVARLRKLVLQSHDFGESKSDTLIDIFMDIHIYAGIALMMLDDKNFIGKE